MAIFAIFQNHIICLIGRFSNPFLACLYFAMVFANCPKIAIFTSFEKHVIFSDITYFQSIFCIEQVFGCSRVQNCQLKRDQACVSCVFGNSKFTPKIANCSLKCPEVAISASFQSNVICLICFSNPYIA